VFVNICVSTVALNISAPSGQSLYWATPHPPQVTLGTFAPLGVPIEIAARIFIILENFPKNCRPICFFPNIISKYTTKLIIYRHDDSGTEIECTRVHARTHARAHTHRGLQVPSEWNLFILHTETVQTANLSCPSLVRSVATVRDWLNHMAWRGGGGSSTPGCVAS